MSSPKDESRGDDSTLELGRLQSTAFKANGDAPRTVDGLSKRTWYGKKRQPQLSSDGSGMTAPIAPKHRKVFLLKKLLNVGDKLKPLGLGHKDSDEGQAETNEEGDDEDPTATAAHVTQDRETRAATNSNLQYMEQNRDLCIQVIEGKGLLAADSNGSSDPYCRVRVGASKVQTKVTRKNLNPRWNETFVFPAEDVEGCMLGNTPKITFELWDSDFLGRDQFLGQAQIDLTEITLKTSAIEPIWRPLSAEKNGKRVDGLGEVQIACWLAPAGQLGRLDHSLEAPKTMLTTLCSPPGVTKSLPLVVHTEGNCLYEEPCIHYLSLNVGQVRDLEQFLASSQAMTSSNSGSSRNPLPSPDSTTTRSRRVSQELARGSSPSPSPSPPQNQREEVRQLDALGRQAWHEDKAAEDGGATEDGASESGKGAESQQDEVEEEEELEDDGEDPFDEGEQGMENPLQVPSSEADAAPPSSAPMRDKRLYFEVSFGNQRRRTRIARLKDRAFSWDHSLAFAATVPIRNKPFKLLLCEVDRQNQKSRLLAIAFIPLLQLMSTSKDSERGEWFRLHDYNKRAGGKPISFGAVRLKLNGADADDRRVLFGQPLLESEDQQARDTSGRGQRDVAAARTDSAASEDSMFGQSVTVPSPLTSPDKSDTCSNASTSGRHGYEPLGSQYESSISMYLGRKRTEMRGSVLSAENAKGLSRLAWHFVGLFLLLLQFVLAVFMLLMRFQNNICKRAGQQWRLVARRIKMRRTKWRKTSQKLHPPKPRAPAKPLGLVKLMLASVELVDQPVGSYFCVLKCGPHWGKTSLVKNTDHPTWLWEVHVPLYDPNSLFQLSIFKDQQRRNTKRLTSLPPLHLGKLRIRLNTLEPGRQYNAQLPMLSDRKQGGERTATAHLQAKVIYFEEKAVVRKYFEAAKPREVYAEGLHEGNVAKQLDFEYRRLTMRWLESTNPAISRTVSKTILSSDRQQFVFSRAKANWTRFMIEKERFTWIIRFWKRNQQWENPLETIALMCGLVTFCFYPQIILCGLMLALVSYSLLTATQRPEAPYEMRADPQDKEEDDEVADKGGITQLRRKYERLVRVALAVQNYLEDMANSLERLHALVNWADPKATLIFLFICLTAVLLVAAFSLPVVLSVTLCWTVRHPCLRQPTPPKPLNYLLRLPTRSDQII